LNALSTYFFEQSLRERISMSTGNSTTPTPGYAAGNILNMLVHLGADLTGYDFSRLAVWEAYVQGVENGSGNRTNCDREDAVGKVWAMPRAKAQRRKGPGRRWCFPTETVRDRTR
jgi:hypothetical protein